MSTHHTLRDLPSHDLGGGWKRQMIQLAAGETADNPASTKPERALRGPGFIVYDTAPDGGITTHEYDSAGDFYRALRS